MVPAVNFWLPTAEVHVQFLVRVGFVVDEAALAYFLS
jgi:hypothetical protein